MRFILAWNNQKVQYLSLFLYIWSHSIIKIGINQELVDETTLDFDTDGFIVSA